MKAYDKSITNIILNREKLKPFPFKSGMRQRCPFSPLLFNRVLEFLIKAIRQEREIQWIHLEKEEVKLSLSANDKFLYLKDPKNSAKKLLYLIKTFNKVAGYKISTQKLVSLLYTNNEQSEENNTICNSFKKLKYLGIHLKK
jgi:hypothetical protein